MAVVIVVGGLHEVTTADCEATGTREHGHGGGKTDR